MKKIFSVLILCILVGCTSENRYHIDEITNPTDTLGYLKYDMSLLNGVVYNDFGEVGVFVNGKRNGFHRQWYKNGQLRYEWRYSNNNCTGYRRWYKNGQIDQEENYKNDKYDGIQKVWYENGLLKFEMNYVDGMMDGVQKKWYENGQLEHKEYFKKDQKNGLSTDWRENGLKLRERNYDHDELNGISRIWFPNGQIQYQGNYQDGKLIKSQVWDEDGYRLGTMSFSDIHYMDFDGYRKWKRNTYTSDQLERLRD